MPDLKTIIAKLRSLLSEYGNALAHSAFEMHAQGLTDDERDYVRFAVFGPPAVKGDVHLNDSSANIAVGTNFGTIIFGHDLKNEQREHLVSYLERMVASLERMPLRGLAQKLDDGKGVSLPSIYILLATRSSVNMVQVTSSEYARYFQNGDLEQPLLNEYDPSYVLPNHAITGMNAVMPEGRVDSSDESVYMLQRQFLATEAVHEHQRLVLLGEPGSGKSTFLHHLAWVLARRGIDKADDTTQLMGWNDDDVLLPVILSLRKLAGQLAKQEMDKATVIAALREEIAQGYDMLNAAELLDKSLTKGSSLLLFDGLDEVPIKESPGERVSREVTLLAVRSFIERYPKTTVVLTCRTRAFNKELRDLLGWHVEIIAPLSLGQMRHFAHIWYGELASKGSIGKEQAPRLEQQLITSLVESKKLASLADTPLLLTSMALIQYHDGVLPRDRPLLYERILTLLLGQWDKIHGGESLTEVIGRPNWQNEFIQPLLDQLAFEAHISAVSEDGRGRLRHEDIFNALNNFFLNANLNNPETCARRCLEYIESRSGLLIPDDNRTYVFAHLTLQEHCAGRHLMLADQSKAPDEVLRHRTDDRWREPIFLGVGVLQQKNPALIDRILSDLIDHEEGYQEDARHEKDVRLWHGDLILAAEIGRDRDWNLLRTQRVAVDRLQRDLKNGLVKLLEERAQNLSFEDRVRAGGLLGELGDQRFPSTEKAWRDELIRRSETFSLRAAEGQSQPYWCYVRPGTYRIGGWTANQPNALITLPGFWISRFPITVTQFMPFVERGYSTEGNGWWTPTGHEWKRRVRRMGPRNRNVGPYMGQNQPVIGIAWYEATAWTKWLMEQLDDAVPSGFKIRLPTEAEWEAACYGRKMEQFPYPWGNSEPTIDHAVYAECNLGRPAPVGSCPLGIAACGAHDMLGNVWEWTSSYFMMYPKDSNQVVQDFMGYDAVALRGGAYWEPASSMTIGARTSNLPEGNLHLGFRIVLAPIS